MTLTRDPTGVTNWIYESGRTNDAVGGFDGQYFETRWPNLQRRIRAHINKADFVPVDVANFTPGQAQRVADFVGSLDNPGVFIVGSQS